MFDFPPFMLDSVSDATGVDTYQETPRDEMNVFFRNERAFLPPGKDFSDLTNEELAVVSNKYRWDVFLPGCYQGITGIGHVE